MQVDRDISVAHGHGFGAVRLQVPTALCTAALGLDAWLTTAATVPPPPTRHQRRAVLRGALLGAAGTILSACTGSPAGSRVLLAYFSRAGVADAQPAVEAWLRRIGLHA
nr:hypothetical protein GCM10020092_073530 [Actinoplanes digitatis]